MCILACVNTHSDPDESPSTVPALMLMATPFSWSGRPGLAGPARPSLEEDPRGDAVPGAFSQSSLWMRLRPFLSTIGESCFFFRIPAQERNSFKIKSCQCHYLESGIILRPHGKGIFYLSIDNVFKNTLRCTWCLCIGLNITFMRVGVEVWQTGQQHRHGVLCPAIW